MLYDNAYVYTQMEPYTGRSELDVTTNSCIKKNREK